MSFLDTQSDIIIFASCIGGFLVVCLLVALVGFCWMQCSFFKTRKTRKSRGKRKNVYDSTQQLVPNVKTISRPTIQNGACPNHYPTWLYDTMVSEHVRHMSGYLDNEVQGNDADHYINEVFSDVYEESKKTSKKDKTVGYERQNKMITPLKKPTVPVPYYKNEKTAASNDVHKDKLKISLDKEARYTHQEKATGGIVVPFDDIDLDLFEIEDDQESTDAKRLFFPKELTVGEKIKARNFQTVEYENPKFAEKARRKKQDNLQELENSRRKRIVLEQDQPDQNLFENVEKKPKKKIMMNDTNISTTMDQNFTQDSFLF